jgi:hypothetical protein
MPCLEYCEAHLFALDSRLRGNDDRGAGIVDASLWLTP